MRLRLRNPFPSIASAPLYRKFWFVGGAVGLFLLTITIGNQFLPRDRALTREMLGHDFLVFYTAGRFAREHRMPALYDLHTIEAAEHRTGEACNLEMNGGFGPWWNPPFAAWIWAPLSVLPYPDALDAWRAFSVIAALASVVLLIRMLPAECGWQIKLLVPLGLITSMPLLQAASHGQNTFLSLMLLTATVALWRARQGLVAGIVCGLLFYKPQLGAIVALVLIADLGRRALLGVSITGAFLSLMTVFTMPGALLACMQKLGPNLRWMQEENHYMWQRHITLKALWRLLFQGSAYGPSSWPTVVFWTFTMMALGGALAYVALRFSRRRRADGVSRDQLIAATIVSMPLLMPFYFDYDLVLMIIPATLLAAELLQAQRWMGNDPEAQHPAYSERWVIRAWGALYGWTLVNTAIAAHLRLNLTTLAMIAVAVLTIRRALRTNETGQMATSSDAGRPTVLRTLAHAA